MRIPAAVLLLLSIIAFSACSTGGGNYGYLGGPNMGGPPVEVRKAEIASEPTGNFFYGRRYFVYKTRFWGYLRKPRQAGRQSRLVVFNESRKLAPDRLPEDGPPGARFGFDQNHEYRIYGNYTGVTVYEPNSNQFLPEFMLTDFQLVKRQPGWLFSPRDHYDDRRVTLLP
jgi:hypothetical protein